MPETTRKLASVRRISAINPIPGADAIEVATVGGWKVVVKKGEYRVGDLAVYYEIDSFLPERPEFEFLRKSSFKKDHTGRGGFRLRTIKLRGQVSQGLLTPVYQDAYEADPEDESKPNYVNMIDSPTGPVVVQEGDDVTSWLGVTKWDPPVPAQLAGKVKGNFPSRLRKTDEERVQNLDYQELLTMRSNSGPFGIYSEWYAAEKLDGSSMTCYLLDGEFGVCSRNLDLKETEGNTFWQVARAEKIEEKMRDVAAEFGGDAGWNFAVQGELIGPGIQGNPYKLAQPTFRLFNVIDVDGGMPRLPFRHLRDVAVIGGFVSVPVLDKHFDLPDAIEDLIASADGPSVLNAQTKREGLVIRSHDGEVSFKVISNAFLLKQR